MAVLQAVGVQEGDERIYRLSLAHPTATVERLARLSGQDIDRVSAALTRLERLGLVRRNEGGYVPVNPQVAVQALVQRRHAEVDMVKVVCEELVERFRTGHSQSQPGHLIDVVTGPEAVSRCSRELLTAATREVMVMDQPPYAAPLVDEVAVEAPVLRWGVRVRVIYSLQAMQIAGRFRVINQLIDAGEQARTLSRLPIKLRIYDQTATVPLTIDAHATQSVAVIHQSGLLNALISLFEMYWTRAHPIGTVPPSLLDRRQLGEDELRVLGMLDAGFTDPAIAGQLGISLRTLRRRVRNILHVLEVTTRFQAGRQAHLRGLLPHHQPAPRRAASRPELS